MVRYSDQVSYYVLILSPISCRNCLYRKQQIYTISCRGKRDQVFQNDIQLYLYNYDLLRPRVSYLREILICVTDLYRSLIEAQTTFACLKGARGRQTSSSEQKKYRYRMFRAEIASRSCLACVDPPNDLQKVIHDGT